MAQPRPPGGPRKRRQVQRSGPQEREPDLQTAMEDEMAASGHHSIVPRSGVIGAHPERVISSSSPSIEDGMKLPPGVEVAPTRMALEREHERHHPSAPRELPAPEAAAPVAPPQPQKPRRGPAKLIDRGREGGRVAVGIVDLLVGLAQLGGSHLYSSVRSRFGRQKSA